MKHVLGLHMMNEVNIGLSGGWIPTFPEGQFWRTIRIEASCRAYRLAVFTPIFLPRGKMTASLPFYCLKLGDGIPGGMYVNEWFRGIQIVIIMQDDWWIAILISIADNEYALRRQWWKKIGTLTRAPSLCREIPSHLLDEIEAYRTVVAWINQV